MINKLNELKQYFMIELQDASDAFREDMSNGNIASAKYWLGKKNTAEDIIIKLDLLIIEYSHEAENKSL